jgi:hypothetical protein
MADQKLNFDVAFPPSSRLAFSPRAQIEERAFPKPYLEIEAGDYSSPRVSGGLAADLGNGGILEIGGERAPTDKGPSYGGTVKLRKSF